MGVDIYGHVLRLYSLFFAYLISTETVRLPLIGIQAEFTYRRKT